MEILQTFVDVEGDTITVSVPEAYRHHRVKVTVEPVVENDRDTNVIPIPKSGTQILSQPDQSTDMRRFRGVLKGKAGEDLEAHYQQIHNEWERDL